MWQNDWEIKLKDLRNAIDGIDKQIINEIVQRVQLCERIAEIKAEHKLPIYVPWREKEILDKRCEWGLTYNLGQKFVRILFKLVMLESKRWQKELIEAKSAEAILN